MRSPQRLIPVSDVSAVGEARRAAAALAAEIDLDETAAGRVQIVATELATNLVRHAGSGEMLLQVVAGANGAAIELIALDRGPGMEHPERCLRDGYSTGGTAGAGLGAVRRLADEFDLDSHVGIGTIVMARVGSAARATVADRRRFALGGVCVPMQGEIACGDAWRAAQDDDALALLVVDGLGHGPFAAEASREATLAFEAAPFAAPAELIAVAHQRMAGTRGAALATARVDAATNMLVYAGVGNIAGTVLGGEGSRGLASHNGTVGATLNRVQEFSYPWPIDATLVMHSDGIGSRWQLDRYPGLRTRHPALLAGVLYRDFARGRDDVTVLVARRCAA